MLRKMCYKSQNILAYTMIRCVRPIRNIEKSSLRDINSGTINKQAV
jgi:hypothetical protein